jgi:hypothetical protein
VNVETHPYFGALKAFALCLGGGVCIGPALGFEELPLEAVVVGCGPICWPTFLGAFGVFEGNAIAAPFGYGFAGGV